MCVAKPVAVKLRCHATALILVIDKAQFRRAMLSYDSSCLLLCYCRYFDKTFTAMLLVFMPPTLKKWGAYWFRLVRPCVRPSFQKKILARVLKFHIWIPRQKIVDQLVKFKKKSYFFFFSNYLPLQI